LRRLRFAGPNEGSHPTTWNTKQVGEGKPGQVANPVQLAATRSRLGRSERWREIRAGVLERMKFMNSVVIRYCRL
jgi:hypothetical protein